MRTARGSTIRRSGHAPGSWLPSSKLARRRQSIADSLNGETVQTQLNVIGTAMAAHPRWVSGEKTDATVLAQHFSDNLVIKHGMLPGGHSIKNYISPDLYAALAKHLEKSNRSLAVLRAPASRLALCAST